MATNYKRVIIQFPLDELSSFEEYAKKYSCSLSSTIVQFAIKGRGYEDTMLTFPKVLSLAEKENAQKKKQAKSKAKKTK